MVAEVRCGLVGQDTVSNFYEITKNEVRDYDLSIRAKEREVEMLEENHRVEVRVRSPGELSDCALLLSA